MKYLVYNETYNTYAGRDVGRWTDHAGARRFNEQRNARTVAGLLTFAEQGRCYAVPETHKPREESR